MNRAPAATAPDRDREFSFGPDDHAAIAALAYAEAGILLPPNKAHLVYGRLARRLRACGIASFADYIEMLAHDPVERATAIDALTTNHTSFFREAHHFEHFMAEYWPALSRRLDGGGCVRLWSAACSSGEEPYTLAMAMLGRDRAAARRLKGQDLRFLATDLSGEILAAARTGRYALDTARTVPQALRDLWMETGEREAVVRAEVRDLIAFRPLNLLRDWPMKQHFDAIFCRNVMIYFDDPTKARLQTRMADQLVPGGFLYIGHSERLAPEVANRFDCVGRTTFRKHDR